MKNRTAAHNSTYKKLAVQWLNEALCFVSNFVVADSFVLRNRQLLVAAKRYGQPHFDVFPCRIKVEYVNQTIGVNWAEVVFFKILST